MQEIKDIKLLIVDDEDGIIDAFENSIKTYNMGNNGITYKHYVAKSFDKAKEILETYIIDTAIVDINLDGRSSGNFDGNNVIKEILKYLRMPIFVVSGTPSHLDDSFKNNAMIKSYTREADINEKLFERDIPNSIQSPTLAYFSRNGYLENKVTKFYWEDLSKTIEHWEKVAKEKPQEIDKILSRHTLSCLNEKLYVNGNIGKFDEYHPGEMYIVPPIKQHYHTGDIVKKNEEFFVILNPACDIVSQKIEFYVLAKITAIDKNIDNIKRNKGKECYYYLPYFANIFPKIPNNIHIINFQNLQTTQSCDKYERVASISAPFLKDIIARFSRYYARQGQPNLMQH